MSATRAEYRRADRFNAKSDQYLATNFWPMPSTVMHGACRRSCCNRRTYLTLPAAICKRCVGEALAFRWVCERFGVTL